MAEPIKNRGIIVAGAGTGINLALGVLYTWSIFKGAIKQSIETGGAGAFQWDLASLNDPYAVCCLVFAFSMIIAGKIQDSLGPRITAMTGGVLVGLGFLWISQTTSYVSWIIGFGVLVGMGIAFGYSSATPPALKWFAPNKTGKVAGVVVSGFGLASVYIAPLAIFLLGKWGMQGAMMFFGVAFLLVVCFFASFLVNPPEGYSPEGFVDRRSPQNQGIRASFKEKDLPPGEIIKQPSFWLLWFLYFIAAGAGLMVIGSVAGMAKNSLGDQAFLAVAILAIGNAAGRIVAGIISDKIGRRPTLAAILAFQALLMFAAIPIVSGSPSAPLLVLLATLIGFNYGANLSLFPSFTKDLWGIKHFGVNYGFVFSAWGVGGFVLSRVSQSLLASTNGFSSSFTVAGILLAGGTILSFMLKNEKGTQRRMVRKPSIQSA